MESIFEPVVELDDQLVVAFFEREQQQFLLFLLPLGRKVGRDILPVKQDIGRVAVGHLDRDGLLRGRLDLLKENHASAGQDRFGILFPVAEVIHFRPTRIGCFRVDLVHPFLLHVPKHSTSRFPVQRTPMHRVGGQRHSLRDCRLKCHLLLHPIKLQHHPPTDLLIGKTNFRCIPTRTSLPCPIISNQALVASVVVQARMAKQRHGVSWR